MVNVFLRRAVFIPDIADIADKPMIARVLAIFVP
jgi:hypothetical protein